MDTFWGKLIDYFYKWENKNVSEEWWNTDCINFIITVLLLLCHSKFYHITMFFELSC